MITVFSCPKSFTNPHIATIQRNAINSWIRLHPDVEVLLFGDDPGVASVARELNVTHIPQVERNSSGTPLISDIFRQAQLRARHSRMVYANGDIILLDDLLSASGRIGIEKFILVGRRTDVDIPEALPFDDTWQSDLRTRIARDGKLHSYSGIDYFLFPRGLWLDMPPFAVGRPSWDNWLLHEAWLRRHPVIDATARVLCVHQNHDYSHVAGGFREVLVGAEEGENTRLAANGGRMFSIRDADFILTPRGLQRAPINAYRLFTFPFRHYYRAKFMRPLLFPGHLMVVQLRRFRRFLFLRANDHTRDSR